MGMITLSWEEKTVGLGQPPTNSRLGLLREACRVQPKLAARAALGVNLRGSGHGLGF